MATSAFKLAQKEHKFSSSWTLWFHHVNVDDWSNESYIKVVEGVDNIEKFINMTKNLHQVTSGMFFLMLDGVFPTYEDEKNIGGGYWAFRVGKKNSNLVWFDLMTAMVGNTLTKDVGDMATITGVQISPKIKNCIFKVWNSDKRVRDSGIFTDEIEGIIPDEAQYRSHEDNIRRDKGGK